MTALELYFFEENEFEQTLRDKVNQAPGFFKDTPLIISLEKYEGQSSELDFFKIIGTCRRQNIHVIGVRGGNDDQRRLARSACLALLPGGNQRDREISELEVQNTTSVVAEQNKVQNKAQNETSRSTEPGEPVPARIVNQPVRSGQQVYAPEGDLIILASVQAGAEVLAAGNVHVYGPLRGRALAGIHGAEHARVFANR